MLTKILIGLAAGAVSGLVAALCGVGGGVIMVPAFVYFLGMPQKMAVATSLAVIIPTSLVATYKNSANGFIHWPTVAATAIGAAVVAWFAADLLKKLQDDMLTKVFAILMLFVGIQLLTKKSDDKANTTPQPEAESVETK